MERIDDRGRDENVVEVAIIKMTSNRDMSCLDSDIYKAKKRKISDSGTGDQGKPLNVGEAKEEDFPRGGPSLLTLLEKHKITQEAEKQTTLTYGNLLSDVCTTQTELTVDLCKLLIDSGADVNKVDETGRTLLHVACSSQTEFTIELCKLLIESGAHVNIVDETGCTPLHAACWTQTDFTVELWKLLIDSGADVNVVDETVSSHTFKWPHLGDDHYGRCLLMAERVVVTQTLLSQVGGYDGLCRQLMKNKRLKEIKCVLNKDNKDFETFCNFLKVLKTITSLTVGGDLSCSAAHALSEALKTNTAITSLTLYWKWIEPSAATPLSDALKTNTTITSLTLDGEWSDLHAATALSDALKMNTTITSLILHVEWSGRSAATALSDALKTNTTITSLTLHWRGIDPYVATALSDVLKTNTTITSIDLHGEWADRSAAAFSEALKTNTTITSLNLHWEWSDTCAIAAVFSKFVRKGLTITVDKDYSMVVGANDKPRCLWISGTEIQSASLASRVLSKLYKCIHNSIDAQLKHGPFLL